MSTPIKDVPRRNKMLGSNIRVGFTPGGFTKSFPLARCEHTRRARTGGSITAAEIKEAAKAVLEKRGHYQCPTLYRDSTAPFSDARQIKPVVGPLHAQSSTPHVNPPAAP